MVCRPHVGVRTVIDNRVRVSRREAQVVELDLVNALLTCVNAQVKGVLASIEVVRVEEPLSGLDVRGIGGGVPGGPGVVFSGCQRILKADDPHHDVQAVGVGLGGADRQIVLLGSIGAIGGDGGEAARCEHEAGFGLHVDDHRVHRR